MERQLRSLFNSTTEPKTDLGKSQRPMSANPLVSAISLNKMSLSRRRGMAFTATLPFLLPLHEFIDNVGTNAVESGQSEYMLIKEEISKVVTKGKAAGVLRLVFHDAGTFEMAENSGAMNGSIIYEFERPESAGLKKSQKVVEKAKKEVDAIQ